jgi:beta-glucosidase
LFLTAGFVVSDWGATHDSAADNANAGLDMEMPGDWILIGTAVFPPGKRSSSRVLIIRR